MNSEYVSLASVGYYICDLPKNIFEFAKHESEKFAETKFKNQKTFKSNLAGAIEHEYIFKTPATVLNNFFEKVISDYWEKQFNFSEARKKYNLLRTPDGPSVWVNFQIGRAHV